MIVIDGAQGEGGGQILRTTLSLAATTGTPVRLVKIRAGRERPGLLPQHLTAIRAVAAITGGEVEGDTPGSQEVVLRPGAIRPGEYRFEIGSAGSACLVLQAVLPPLFCADEPSTVFVDGGTHNHNAPPFEYLDRVLFPLIQRMGPGLSATLERAGFYPTGGGRIRVDVTPTAKLTPIELLERGAIRRRTARALVAELPVHIAKRELRVVARELGWPQRSCRTEVVAPASGPGNALLLEVETHSNTEVITGFGRLGVRAEQVAAGAARMMRRWLKSDVPVGPHLADQLLLPMALAGGGVFRTTKPTSHSLTNAMIIEEFLPVEIHFDRERREAWRVEILPRSA